MKYLQKRLVRDRDLQEYSDCYYEVILVRLNPGFLRGRDVYGFFDGQGKMIAGYVINNMPPFRILQLIPADREDGRRFAEGHEGEFSELIAMWKTSRSKFFYALYYLQLMATLLRCKSKWLLGAAIRKYAHEFYLRFLPNVIYVGAPDPEFQQSGGTGNEKHVWVQYGPIRGMSHHFAVEGAEFAAQQLCEKLIPRTVMTGGVARLGRKIQEVIRFALYPLARVVLLFVRILSYVQSALEQRDIKEERDLMAPNGTQSGT
jgi:hypothetical protein